MKTTRKNQLSRTIEIPERQTSKLGFDTSMLRREVGFGENGLNGKNQPLRVAQIAPAWLSVPPQNYGGTESSRSVI
ncbi:MAG: glycosyltransferase family 4 protein [Calothrix sp. SM1_7_51]|nr:glycosyltransferase family 4 protein [Calothrix sp. SM1_7_51]